MTRDADMIASYARVLGVHARGHATLLPLADLRLACGLDRADFDAAILELEAAYVLDLKIANNVRATDPRCVRAGIESERGLLVWAVVRVD